jgi:phenylacetic acid degradation operon negative regulatory protein
MAPHPLTRIVSRFKREPSRTGSLVITFHGDAVVPRGGVVWLGTLLKFLDLLSIEGGVVRTAVSRLAADGWLARERLGRKSFYRLAPQGRARFEAAVAHVYDPPPAPGGAGFEVLLIGGGTERDRARGALEEAGFGSPLPGVWVAPAGTPVPDEAQGALRLEAAADRAMGQQLVAASWDLARTAAAYRTFVDLFAPLAEVVGTSAALSPDEAMLARILLIHHYRRVVLRDPLLPPDLLPPAWPAGEARAFCAGVYRALLPASEQWLDACGESLAGPLPAAGAALARRFADIDMLQKRVEGRKF